MGFDPAQYGMEMHYDEGGNYIYPEGFDAETGEWKPGFEAERDEWERKYAEAHARWEAEQAALAEQQAAAEAAGSTTSYTSDSGDASGTLAGDDALAKLREQLAAGEGGTGDAGATTEAGGETPAETAESTENAAE